MPKTMRNLAALFLALTPIAVAQQCTADGLVLNAITSQPVPHAQVAAESPDSQGASTDAEGKWTIPGLPCGRLRLTVTGPHFLPSTSDGTTFHDLRIKLTPESSLTGRITDADGNPVSDARIQSFRTFLHDGTRDLLPFSNSQNTESTGAFFIPLQPAPYVICAQSDDVLYPVGGGGQLRYPESCLPVTIHPGDQAHLDFTLSPVPAVHVQGSVAGLPAGVEAIVELRNAAIPGAPPLATRRASANRFDFPGIIPNDYTLQASAVSGEKSFFALEDVTVGSGGVTGVRLTALPGVSITGSVRFVNASEQPKPNVAIHLFPDSGTLQWDASGEFFSITNVVPRKYRIAVTADNSAYARSLRFQDRDVQGKEFVLSAAGNLEIVMAEDAGSIQGTVTDSDGQPVAATVFLGDIMLRAGKDGKFAVNKIPPGHYTAYAVDDQSALETADPAPAGTPVDVPPLGSVSVALVKSKVPK